jgi:hypothetical protein
MHCAIQGDTKWGKLSAEDIATLAGRTVHEASLQETVKFLLAADMPTSQSSIIKDTLLRLAKWTNRATEPCMIFGPMKNDFMNDSAYFSEWIPQTPITRGKMTLLFELASVRCISWPLVSKEFTDRLADIVTAAGPGEMWPIAATNSPTMLSKYGALLVDVIPEMANSFLRLQGITL